MPDQAGGAVAIWHDIVAEGLDEFYAWHGEEHMPERLGIPGFVRGRRFIAIDADLMFFNLYETSSPDVVKGNDYRARLNDPTPRTLGAVRHFRNVARSLCRIAARIGNMEGGTVATLRYDISNSTDESHLDRMRADIMPELMRLESVGAAMLLAADRDASGEINAEQRARGSVNVVPRFALIAEGWGDPAKFTAHIRDALRPERLKALGVADESSLGFYRHQITQRPIRPEN